MPRVVVAGSENDTSFAVIDFTTPGSPAVVRVNPGFAAGCRVAINGTSAAVGSVLSGEVRLVDVTTPAAPIQQGSINTMLSGIGAIAVRGTRVAVGEFINSFQARAKLIDYSNSLSPSVIGTAPTPLTSVSGGGTQTLAAISSIAFLSDNVVFVSGPALFQIYQIDFTNPGAPVVTMFTPVLSGGISLDVDAAASRLAAGDNNSTVLKLFNATSKALIGQANTTLGGVLSVAVKSPLVLAGGPNDIQAVRVDFSGAPTVAAFNPGLGGGCTTAIEGTIGACGAILGTHVALINLVPSPPAILGSADAGIASISTLAISTFTPATIGVNPGALNYGAVRVNTSATLNLTLSNTGTLPLTISNIASSNPRFTFLPAGPLTIAPPCRSCSRRTPRLRSAAI
jgi:hypothetical protein